MMFRMSGALSPTHWLIILVVLVVLFGAKKLPDAARGVGQSLRIFKAEIAAVRDEGPDVSGDAPAAPDLSGAPSSGATRTPPLGTD